MIRFVRSDLRELFPEHELGQLCAIPGRTYRQVAGRRTVRFERGGRGFFIKCHEGVGWREIGKNLVSLRLPVLGARQEWRAIRAVERLGVQTTPLVAYGEEGWSPAARRSFLITEDLGEAPSLEAWAGVLQAWPDPRARLPVKRALVRKVAALARTLHEHGINHRDLYLCHLRLDLHEAELAACLAGTPLQLMDLHRAQVRRRVPLRWRAKDLDGLLYSTVHGPAGLALTRGDLLCFLKVYLGPEWRRRLRAERRLWRLVVRRYQRDYRKDHGRTPALPAFLARALGA